MNPSPETAALEPAVRRPRSFWPAVLLFVLTALVFLRATKAGFLVYDDTTFVTRNPHVLTGLTWSNVGHAFIGMDEVNWEPLTTLSHMLDCQIFGQKPWGHHLVNVLIHAFNAAGLFLLLRKMTSAPARSWFVAALFALHPLRVESVAWIAERKDVLCMSFWLLATWAYVCYIEQRQAPSGKKYYRLCLLLFVLGLMAKPMMVTFPFFLMLLDYWPLRRTSDFKPALADKVPLLLLSAMDCAVTFLLQKQYGAVDTLLPYYARAENAVIAYSRYLGKFFWPANLAVLYPIQEHWPVLILITAAAVLIIISAAAFSLRKHAPWFIVGWLWFLGTLVPVIGLVQVGEQSIADRYTYIPMIGLAVILIWGACQLTCRRPALWVAPMTALLVCCGVLTWKQLGYWQDSHVLFEHTVQVTKDNFVAETILGDVYHGHGEPERAMELFKAALRAKPDFSPAVELLKLAQSEQAIAFGKTFLRQGNYDEALLQFRDAEKLRYGNPEAHYSVGVVYKYKNQFRDAEKELRLALALKPDSYQVRRFLGYTLMEDGKKELALPEFETAVKEHPDSFEAHSDLAKALAAAGRRQDCIAELKLALQLRPGDQTTASHLAQMQAGENR